MAINVAVIGLGKMGLSHLAIVNALDDFNVIAICDSAALVGQVIDRTDAGTGYLVAVAAGILAVTCAGGIHVRARLE